MTTLDLQITFDAADPHALARFWVAALDLTLEDHDDLIGQMLDAGHASPIDIVVIEGRRAWAGAAGCHDPQGRYPRFLFLQVPEGKTAKNRVHLDFHLHDTLPDDRDGAREAEVARLISLGATKLHDGSLGPQRWVTLADPEGNEFCVG
jgi:hypothetical protein